MDIKKSSANKSRSYVLKRVCPKKSLLTRLTLIEHTFQVSKKGERNVSITVIEKIANPKALKVKITDLFNE